MILEPPREKNWEVLIYTLGPRVMNKKTMTFLKGNFIARDSQINW